MRPPHPHPVPPLEREGTRRATVQLVAAVSHSRGTRGFTLVELILILAVIIILSGLAVPAVLEWRSGIDSGRAARMAYDLLREARSRAMSSNYQHMVAFQPDTCRFELVRGKRGYNTPGCDWDRDHPVQDWLELGRGLTMRSGADGGSSATVNVQFNADGTARLESPAGTPVVSPASTVTVSFQGGAEQKRYSVVVSTCGRITLQ
jgi:Tfp pilus assembly protein FimT